MYVLYMYSLNNNNIIIIPAHVHSKLCGEGTSIPSSIDQDRVSTAACVQTVLLS